MASPRNLEIRNATAADLPSIVRMLADDELGQASERHSEPLAESYQRAFTEISESDTNELLVASIEDEVVGVLQITYIPYLTFLGGKRALIEGIRVDSARRSQGIGRLMVQTAMNKARDRGCHMIQLTTNKSRPDAIRFYESLGFESTHEGLKCTLEEQ